MKKLLNDIAKIQKTEIKKIVDERIKSFEKLGKENKSKLFSELCFCIMTANFNAERGIKIQNNLKECFLVDNQNTLSRKLKIEGHRFPNTRARYIVEAREKFDELIEKLKKVKEDSEIRQWIAKNIKGLGMKESSHFLRNIGRKNCAIIDFHIIDLLVKYNLLSRPKTITKNVYLQIEKLLLKIAKKLKISLAELDLYLWYLETGKVLK